MNLIEMLKNELNDGAVDSLSQKLDTSPDQIRSGMSVMVPSVFAGILKKATGAGSLGSLSSIFTGNRQSVEADPETEYGDTSSLLSRGSALVSDLFGEKKDDISKEIATRANLSAEKSQSFLSMSIPLIMAHLDRIIAAKDWSMSDFIGKLFDEKSSIESHLPSGLTSAFGLAGLNLPHLNHAPKPNVNASPSLDRAESNIPESERAVSQDAISQASKTSSGNMLKWIIIIVILILIAWWFFFRNKTGPENVKYMEDTTSLYSTKLNVKVESVYF